MVFQSRFGRGRGRGRLNYVPVTSSLQLWLDASDISPTNIINVAGAVSQWSDKSGNGNHATQGTGAAQPATGSNTLNSKNVLTFDSTNDYLIANGINTLAESPYTLFFVTEPTLQGDAGVLIAWQKFGDVTNPDQLKWQFGTDETLNIDTGIASSLVDSATFQDTALIYSGTGSSTTITSRINGAAADTSPTIADTLPTGLEAFTIGQEYDGGSPGTPSNFYGGDVAEILVYNRVLSTAEITAIETYLSNKWGVALA